MSPLAMLKVKEVARRVTEEEACEVARKALDMDSPQEIAKLLEASSFVKNISQCRGR